MQQAYINGLLTPQWTCLGRVLLPMSLGHFAILEMLGSPYAKGGVVTWMDEITLIWVCSHTYQENVNGLLNRDEMNKHLAKWGRSVGKGKITLEGERVTLNKYLDHYSKTPPRYEDGKSHKAKVPWFLLMAYFLQSKMNKSFNEAMDTPITSALMWYACYGESEGETQLIPEEEEEAIEAMLSNGESK